VVTEYAWDASTCDPCPGPQIATQPPPGRGRRPGAFVLTRLHARYTRDSLGEDLVFREAKPIVGGREHTVDDSGLLEQGAQSGPINNFQARYAIRYPWMGAITCKNPQRGVWGDPPGDNGGEHLFPATNLAFVPRKNFDPWPLIKTNRPVEASLLGAAEKVSSTIPTGLALLAPPPPSASVAPAAPEPPVEPPSAPSAAPSADPPRSPPAGPPRGGCAGCEVSPAASSLPALLALGAAMLLRLRKRTR
jgi:hypothetical protein